MGVSVRMGGYATSVLEGSPRPVLSTGTQVYLHLRSHPDPGGSLYSYPEPYFGTPVTVNFTPVFLDDFRYLNLFVNSY